MLFYLTINAGGDINLFLENVNFDELIVISVKNTYKCIHQFNIHRGVFESGLIPKICGFESAQYSGHLFSTKKRSKKTAVMRKPLRFMWLKGTLKVVETDFQTGTNWYFL